MGLKQTIREEYDKPFNEWSDFLIEWRQSKEKVLRKLIEEGLSKCKTPPKKIVLDRDGYLIFKRHFELDCEYEVGEETLFNTPVEVTYDNLPDYYKLEF